MRTAIGRMGGLGIGLASGVAALMMLAACGSGETPAASTEGQPGTAVPEPVATERSAPDAPLAEDPSTQPAVGDKIPDAASEPEAREDAGPLIVDGYRELAWEELMPEGEEERLAQMYQAQMMELYSKPGGIAEGSTADVAVQLGTFNAVPELDGEKIRLPGYTVPFSYDANQKVSEFLLVPYFGACIHAPPPPPNQTILVRMAEPIGLRDLAQAVWIEGTIKIEIAETDLADAAYVIEADDLEEYEY